MKLQAPPFRFGGDVLITETSLVRWCDRLQTSFMCDKCLLLGLRGKKKRKQIRLPDYSNSFYGYRIFC